MSDEREQQQSSETTYSRRTILRTTAAVIGGAALGASGAARLVSAASPQTGPAGGLEAGTTGYYRSPAPGVPDAYTKLPPVFKSVHRTPGAGGTVTTFQIAYNPPVPLDSSNAYFQELQKRLGVTLKPTLAPADSYDTKSAVLLASGSLPDLMFLSPNAAELKAIQQGAFADLTPYLSGSALHDYPNLARFPSAVWHNAAVNGKIYGVPRPRFLAGGLLMFRQDWARKFGMTSLRNAGDVTTVLSDFTYRDPDGDGHPDTYGLGSNPSGEGLSLLLGQYMFHVPNNWRLNRNGSLTSYLETDEFHSAVAYLRGLYTLKRVYDPDATSMTVTTAKNDIIAGKIGCYDDSVTALPSITGLREKARELNPDAEVVGLLPPGYNGGKGVTYQAGGYFGYTAIPTQAAGDKKRVAELLRILDYFAAPFGSEEYIFLSNGVEGVDYTRGSDGTPLLTARGKGEIGDLPTLTNSPITLYYPGNAKTLQDALYMQNLIRDYLEVSIKDPTLGLYSPTFVSQGPTLFQLTHDRLISIISGRASLGDLNVFIGDWKKQGGDQIRKEYEQAMRNKR